MIQEDYCSFEVAKLLKEKGFNEECFALYNPDDMLIQSGIRLNNIQVGRVKGSYSAPTLQMTMKWLREVYNLHIMVNCIGKVNYDPIVQRFDGKDFEIEGVEVGTTRCINGKWENVRRGFKTYEEACEAAIKYCLKNLI